MTRIKISQLDIVYLSYDEPNCEQNWQHLQSICPRALRVHGVKGSDAAHKACAQLASTDRFVTIDGDNQLRAEFLAQEFDVDLDITHSVLSFAGLNSVNGLAYGNGGVKIWPRHVVENMRTHEAGEGDSAVDFCWALDYVLMPGVWSDVLINHTAHQAWRAGFREGVKLSLIGGQLVRDPAQWRASIARNNLNRLTAWMNVGLDQEQGLWAILGARHGVYKTMLTDWDWTQVQDFDHLDWIWDRELASMVDPLNDPASLCGSLGLMLRDGLALAVAPEPFNPLQSQWFKTLNAMPSRTDARRLR
jgi:hypothetical protein